jgi:hypothetical protein
MMNQVQTQRKADHSQLDAVIEALKTIEQQAGGTSIETALCEQTKSLAVVVKALLVRFEKVEEEVIPAVPRQISLGAPVNFQDRM